MHFTQKNEEHVVKEPNEHEKKELEKQQKEEEQRRKEQEKKEREQTKKIAKYFILGAIAVFLIYFAITKIKTTEPPYTPGNVHWHATLDMSICGKKVDLPRVGIGEHYKGLPLLHTHDDNTIHLEGQIFKKEHASLGAFMDAIDIPFSETTFFNMTNGMKCGEKEGMLKMFINDQPSTAFRDYITRNGDKLNIVFE